MIKMKIQDIAPEGGQLLPGHLSGKKITGGGVYVFKPGETAHPEEHIHDVDEVLIFVQGRGVLPIDGVEYPIETGDVVIVQAGEDHHTRSSAEDTLVAAWYLMDR